MPRRLILPPAPSRPRRPETRLGGADCFRRPDVVSCAPRASRGSDRHTGSGMGQCAPPDGRRSGPECGEVAERSKALDWNSSNIFTGVRGFESHPLRQSSWTGWLPRESGFKPRIPDHLARPPGVTRAEPCVAGDSCPRRCPPATRVTRHSVNQFSTRSSVTRGNSRMLPVATSLPRTARGPLLAPIADALPSRPMRTR